MWTEIVVIFYFLCVENDAVNILNEINLHHIDMLVDSK